MPRPPKYPFAKYAKSGEPYVTEVRNGDVAGAGGGLAAVERLQSAAYTYAKRNGLVCKTARTIVEVGDDIAEWKVRSAVQFADRFADERGKFRWATCFDTKSRARNRLDSDAAPRASSETRLKVCPVCLAEHDPDLALHHCGYCPGCGLSVGFDSEPALDGHDHPLDQREIQAELPEPNEPAPADVSLDSESDEP